MLIEAYHKAEKSFKKNTDLYIVGQGQEEEELKGLIQKYNLTEKIFLCGFQKNPYAIVARCQLQVISSVAEGFSLVLREGTLLGIPAVSTICAGPAEFIRENDIGILTEINVSSLAAGLVKMVNNETLYHQKKKMAEQWGQEYSAKKIYDSIEQLL